MGLRLFMLCVCRLLCDMVMHFPSSQEEITLSVTPLRVSLTNYCEEGKGELTLHCDVARAQDNAASDRYQNHCCSSFESLTFNSLIMFFLSLLFVKHLHLDNLTYNDVCKDMITGCVCNV